MVAWRSQKPQTGVRFLADPPRKLSLDAVGNTSNNGPKVAQVAPPSGEDTASGVSVTVRCVSNTIIAPTRLVQKATYDVPATLARLASFSGVFVTALVGKR